MEKIGFIGLGIMGTPMAGHLLDAGYEVCTAVHSKQPSDELMSKGIQVLDSRKAVAEAADIIITIVLAEQRRCDLRGVGNDGDHVATFDGAAERSSCRPPIAAKRPVVSSPCRCAPAP